MSMNKKKLLIASSFIFVFLLPTVAQDKLRLTLQEANRLGLERNVNVQNASLDQQKLHYQFKEAQSNLYPQLEGYSTFSYFYAIPKMVLPGEMFGQTGLIPVEIGTKYDWNSGVKASQMIYSQSYFTALKLSKKMETFGALSLQQKREELIYQVSQVYFLCQTTQKQIEELELTRKNTNKLLEISGLQKDNGVIRKVDYSRVVVVRNNIQSQIENMQQLYQQQLGLLKFCIGLPIETEIEITDSLAVSVQPLTLEAPNLNNRTELALLNQQIEINKLTAKANKSGYYPTLSGFGQLYYEGQQNEFNYFDGGSDKFFKTGMIGLTLNLPIFDGFEKRSKAKQYAIELKQLENTRRNTQEYFTKEYTDAYRQYQTSWKAVNRELENKKIAEETYQVSELGYSQQVISLTDLLMAENSFTESRLAYYNSLLQLKNAELEVKKSKGELLNQ